MISSSSPSKAMQACSHKYHDILMLTPEHEHWNYFLAASRHFQTITDGAENLIERKGDPDVLVIIHNGTSLIAKSEGYHHGDSIYEMAGVLVHPGYKGQGFNKIMQSKHKVMAEDRHCLIFTSPDPREAPRIIAQQLQRGWTLLSETHPMYQQVEKTKPRNDNPNPKLCFMAVSGTPFAHTLNNGTARLPAAPNPAAFSAG